MIVPQVIGGSETILHLPYGSRCVDLWVRRRGYQVQPDHASITRACPQRYDLSCRVCMPA